MSLTEVFNVAVDFEGVLPHLRGPLARQVEADIAALAAQDGVRVTFHRFVDEDELGGGPSLLAEMPRDFADKIKTLPHVTGFDKPHLQTMPS